MAVELCFEDVEVGTEIGPLIKYPDVRRAVMWAGVSGDYNPVHYDIESARSQGLPDIIVHGQLIGCFLGQLMTDWIGENGVLRKLSCNYRRMSFPNDHITCCGQVINKYVDGADHYVECDIWVENPQKERTVTGKAVVILPSRAGDSPA
jgi:acyl dehydratase